MFRGKYVLALSLFHSDAKVNKNLGDFTAISDCESLHTATLSASRSLYLIVAFGG